MPLRRFAEFALGRLTLTRRLPPPFSGNRIVASGRVGGLKFLFKPSAAWDPELLRIAAALVEPGDVVWDVGANVGLFAAAAASRAGPTGRVIAVEADFDAVKLLEQSAHANAGHGAPVTVLPVAASDSDGFVEFAIARRARAANSIAGYGSSQTGGVATLRTVPSVRLDSLLQHFPPPRVLKIDVEGAEALVLAGATRLLHEVRPRIYCEVAWNSADAVSALLHAAGYRLWSGATFRSRDDPTIERTEFNTVALPDPS